MKSIFYAFLSIILLSSYAMADLSDCKWQEKYIKGPALAPHDIVGQFECYGKGNEHPRCHFRSMDDSGVNLETRIEKKENLPPEHVNITLSIESFETMQWFDCDGKDPEPFYETNGYIQKLIFQDEVYFAYKEKYAEGQCTAPSIGKFLNDQSSRWNYPIGSVEQFDFTKVQSCLSRSANIDKKSFQSGGVPGYSEEHTVYYIIYNGKVLFASTSRFMELTYGSEIGSLTAKEDWDLAYEVLLETILIR